jgi:hypothetical protein
MVVFQVYRKMSTQCRRIIMQMEELRAWNTLFIIRKWYLCIYLYYSAETQDKPQIE